MKEIRKYYPVIEIKEANYGKDHVHLLLSIPPTISVGEWLESLKPIQVGKYEENSRS